LVWPDTDGGGCAAAERIAYPGRERYEPAPSPGRRADSLPGVGGVRLVVRGGAGLIAAGAAFDVGHLIAAGLEEPQIGGEGAASRCGWCRPRSRPAPEPGRAAGRGRRWPVRSAGAVPRCGRHGCATTCSRSRANLDVRA